MTYSFESLSPADFEDLVRDLIGNELSCRFEAFGPGPDGGIDGRHAIYDKTIILQAKHYRGSGFATLKSRMRKERTAIDRTAPDRYILATSVSLTPANKRALEKIIGPSLNNQSDIFEFEELNDLLRKHDKVTKAHIKLWLSDTAILERVIHAASYNRSTLMFSGIKEKLKVYVENASFVEGRRKLESERILIVSGAPGVGKTTLAEMLCYAYISEEWEFVAISSPNDGFKRINHDREQIFFFDDFLGSIELDKQALSANESDFALFLSYVARTPAARLVMTTRAHIHGQARLVSETFSDPRFDVARYMFDVGVYTKGVRARILYNHLFAASVPVGYIRVLMEKRSIWKIVNHKHYNPRIVEWMTDARRIRCFPAERYAYEFLKVLDDPKQIWDKAFRNQIPPRCHHLLFALYFAPDFGMDIVKLKEAFDGINSSLCTAYKLPRKKDDFEESLKTLEGGFVVIIHNRVSFINPSVRDYLKSYLQDKEQLISIASGATNAKYAKRIVDQFQSIQNLENADMQALLENFSGLCERLIRIPVKEDVDLSRPRELANLDMGCGGRIELLLEWWRTCPQSIFIKTATEIARNPGDEIDPVQDANILVEILASLLAASDEERNQTTALSERIEIAIVDILKRDIDPDCLSGLADTIDARKNILGNRFQADMETAITHLIKNMHSNLDHVHSYDLLEEYIEHVEKLAARVGSSPESIHAAQEAIQYRIDDIHMNTTIAEMGEDEYEYRLNVDRFNEKDINNLFAQLIVDRNGSSDST